MPGRPRTVSLPKDEMIQLGEEMVSYVIEKKPLHLSFWYKGVKMYSYHQFKNFCDMPEFSPYYDKALSLISENYINGTIAPPIASRFLRLYFKDLKDEENEKMEYEASLKKEEEKSTTEVIFKVNYDNPRNSIEVSPEKLSITDSPCAA